MLLSVLSYTCLCFIFLRKFCFCTKYCGSVYLLVVCLYRRYSSSFGSDISEAQDESYSCDMRSMSGCYNLWHNHENFFKMITYVLVGSTLEMISRYFCGCIWLVSVTFDRLDLQLRLVLITLLDWKYSNNDDNVLSKDSKQKSLDIDLSFWVWIMNIWFWNMCTQDTDSFVKQNYYYLL